MRPEKLDVRSLLDCGTEGPVRALNSLRWMSRQGQLQWPLEGIRTTPTTETPKAHKHAVVVEPPMIAFLEDATEDHYRLNNSNWRRLLGCWLVGQGGLRYRHLSLSTPTKLTVSTLHAHCARGKQAHNNRPS